MKKTGYTKILTLSLAVLYVLFGYGYISAEDQAQGDIGALMKEARAAYERQDFVTAEGFYKNAVSIKKDAEAYRMLCYIYLKRLDADSAVMYAQEAVAQDSANSDLYVMAGRLYFEKGDILKATELGKKALQFSPDSILACDFLVDIIFNISTRQEWRSAEELILFCQTAFRSFEYSSWARYYIAEIYARQGQLDKATALLEGLLKEPLHEKYIGMSHGLLGSIYVEKGQWDKAIEHSTKSLQFDPRNFMSMNDIAVAMTFKGQYDKAVSYIKDTLSLNANFPAAQKNVAYITGELLRNKKLDMAEDLLSFTKDKIYDKEFARGAAFRLAQVYYIKKQWDKSAGELSALLAGAKEEKEKEYIYRLLGSVYGSKKDIRMAEKYAVMAGAPYYILSKILFDIAGFIIMALIVLAVYIVYRVYCFFRKTEAYHGYVYRFRHITVVFASPALVYPLAGFLLNLIFFRSMVPPADANFDILFLSGGIVSDLAWAGLAAYFIFGKYKMGREEAGICRSSVPFLKNVIILMASLTIFYIVYDYILKILKIPSPVSIIEQMLKTTRDPVVIVLGLTMALALAPVLEEFIFRGFFYQAFRKQSGVVGGALMSSFIFAMIHADILPQGFMPIMLLGLSLAYLRERTGSLAPGIFLHMINNALAFFFYLVSK